VRESFRQKTEEVLEPQERRKLMKELERFSQQKDIPKLVEGLRVLLSDPAKMQLFHHVCRLLPEETQAKFDQLAAASLAGGASSFTSGSGSLAGGGGVTRKQSGDLFQEGCAVCFVLNSGR
jgi:hypothetical protein